MSTGPSIPGAWRPILLSLIATLVACEGGPSPHPPGAGGAGGGGGGGGGEEPPPICDDLSFLRTAACEEGFCWEYPHPAPLGVFGGAVDGEGGLWLSGQGSAPLRWDGTGWRVASRGLPPPSPRPDLVSVGGGGAWLVRGSQLFRHAPGGWEEVDLGSFPPTPNAFLAFDSSRWVVAGGVRRWEAGRWETLPVEGGPFSAVWGADEDDVWVAGGGGLLYRWQGGDWVRLPTGTQTHLRAVWGSSPRDVWISGEAGHLLRWNGDGLQRVALPTKASLNAIAGTGPDEILVLANDGARSTLFRWNGSFWLPLPAPEGMKIRSLWADVDGVWLGGDDGALARWEGGCFRVLPQAPSRFTDLVSDEWAVGDRGLVARGKGGAWERVQVPTEVNLRSVWKWGGETWIAGDGGTLLRGEGGSFRPFGSFGSSDLLVVRGAEGGDLWLGGSDGRLFRASKGSVQTVASPTVWPIRTLAAFPTAAWAGTSHAFEILRWVEGAWRFERNALATPHLFGTGEDDLWLLSVGSDASVLEHWDGSAWWVVPQGGPSNVYAVAPDGAGGVWVSHSPGILSHWDGSRWRSRAVGFRLDALAEATDGGLWVVSGRYLLRWRDGAFEASFRSPYLLTSALDDGEDVWVGGSGGIGKLEAGVIAWVPGTEGDVRALVQGGDDLWAAGGEGLLLRRDDSGWRRVESAFTEDLLALWAGDGRVVAAGRRGTILQVGEDGIHPLEAPTGADLFAVARTAAGLWVSGEDGVHRADEDGAWIQIHPTFLATTLTTDGEGRLWMGAPSHDDGAHLLRADDDGSARFDLGVTLGARGGVAWKRGIALLSSDEGLRAIDREGNGGWLLRPPASLGALSLGEDGTVVHALGAEGGVLRLDLGAVDRGSAAP